MFGFVVVRLLFLATLNSVEEQNHDLADQIAEDAYFLFVNGLAVVEALHDSLQKGEQLETDGLLEKLSVIDALGLNAQIIIHQDQIAEHLHPLYLVHFVQLQLNPLPLLQGHPLSAHSSFPVPFNDPSHHLLDPVIQDLPVFLKIPPPLFIPFQAFLRTGH